MKSVLLIAGPTASGKSAFAVSQAMAQRASIINADALQVYRDLSVISARPDQANLAAAPHQLYGFVPGLEAYSVANWVKAAKAAISVAWADDRLAIVVGGTGLYFRALEQGLAEIPPIPLEIREKWRGFTGSLHEELAKRDAHGAALLLPSDRQRLSRALEVIEATGQPLRSWQQQAQHSAFLKDAQVSRIFINRDRQELYARAEQRFDEMMAAGALDEIERVRDYDPALPMMKAIGVKELSTYLAGLCSREEAVQAAKLATRHYIKRQLTWWRGQMPGWQVLP